MSEPQSETYTCVDCKNPFAFEPHEQDFFRERGWPPPKRCLRCRRQRRDGRDQQQKQDQQPR